VITCRDDPEDGGLKRAGRSGWAAVRYCRPETDRRSDKDVIDEHGGIWTASRSTTTCEHTSGVGRTRAKCTMLIPQTSLSTHILVSRGFVRELDQQPIGKLVNRRSGFNFAFFPPGKKISARADHDAGAGAGRTYPRDLRLDVIGLATMRSLGLQCRRGCMRNGGGTEGAAPGTVATARVKRVHN